MIPKRPTDLEIREALKTMSKSLSYHLTRGNNSGVSALTLGLSALRWTLGEDGGFPAVIEVLSAAQPPARRTKRDARATIHWDQTRALERETPS